MTRILTRGRGPRPNKKNAGVSGAGGAGGGGSFPSEFEAKSGSIASATWQGSPSLAGFSKGAGSGCSDPPANDSLTATPPSGGSPYSTAHLQVIANGTFGQVIQGRYPYCTGNHFYHHIPVSYSAKNKVWTRQVVKLEANNYTPRGSSAGASSHKFAFITWAGGVGARSELEFLNTTWIVGVSQTGRTFTETLLTGTTFGQGDSVSALYTDGEFYEVIGNYEIRTSGANGLAINRWWYRPVTINDGATLDLGATRLFYGVWMQFTGGTAPAQAGGYQFWGNRNRSTDQYPDGSARPSNGSDPFHVYYGPYDIIDGDSNNDPFGLQWQGE